MYCIYVHTDTTSWPRHVKLFFCPAFVTRILTPQLRESGYGLLLGCRSELDAGPFDFFLMISTPTNRENLHCLFWSAIAIDRVWSN